MRLAFWTPPIVWMGVILWLASDHGSSMHTGRIIVPVLQTLFPAASPLQIEALHGTTRKLAHAIEYAILAGLWFRAFAGGAGLRPRAAAWRAWAIAVAWAAIDETYQSTLASRTGTPRDVALDGAAALVIALLGAYGWRVTVDVVSRALLWIAAVGGAGLVAINLLTGVESGVLWLTVPAAVLALLLVRRQRPDTPP